MSSYSSLLDQIRLQLQEVQGYVNPNDYKPYLSVGNQANRLLVVERDTEAEVQICLEETILKRMKSARLPKDFSIESFPDLSVIVEELSHFNSLCASADLDQKVSALELEVQGEVDKFAAALDWLHQKNEDRLVETIFDLQFGNLKLGTWVSEEEETRYRDAHDIARSFCRKLLAQQLTHSEMKSAFHRFFFLKGEDKLRGQARK